MIAWMAPADVPLGGASPLWTMGVGPKWGDGPCGRKVCAAAAVAQTAPASANSKLVRSIRRRPGIRGRSLSRAIQGAC
jgi:hypothetical protein